MLLFYAAPARASASDELEVNWAGDGAMTAGMGIMWIASELVKEEFAVKTCRWCKSNTMDDAVTDALSWDTPQNAAKASDYLDFAGIPVLTLGALALSSGLDGRIGNLPSDAMIYAETLAVSQLVNQIVKYSVSRARPYAFRGTADMYDNRPDENLSFYSGHTSFAFSLVVSAGTIAHIRGYDAEPYIWGIGLPLASFIAYLRISAQKHYFSDVLIGAAIGSAIGFLVPFLHKTSKKTSNGVSNINVSINTQMISIGGTF